MFTEVLLTIKLDYYNLIEKIDTVFQIFIEVYYCFIKFIKYRKKHDSLKENNYSTNEAIQRCFYTYDSFVVY